MSNLDYLLKQYLREQIGLEEHLCRVIEQQISEVDETDFADAKNLLIKTREVLEHHFVPLNEMLDHLERDAVSAREKVVASNGAGLKNPGNQDKKNVRISRMLRDDYSALNLISMSNTLLHTTALVLDCQEVAAIALKHLENLAPIVKKIGDLVPEVVARELRTESPKIDLSVAQTAVKNAQLAWRNAS